MRKKEIIKRAKELLNKVKSRTELIDGKIDSETLNSVFRVLGLFKKRMVIADILRKYGKRR